MSIYLVGVAIWSIKQDSDCVFELPSIGQHLEPRQHRESRIVLVHVISGYPASRRMTQAFPFGRLEDVGDRMLGRTTNHLLFCHVHALLVSISLTFN